MSKEKLVIRKKTRQSRAARDFVLQRINIVTQKILKISRNEKVSVRFFFAKGLWSFCNILPRKHRCLEKIREKFVKLEWHEVR